MYGYMIVVHKSSSVITAVPSVCWRLNEDGISLFLTFPEVPGLINIACTIPHISLHKGHNVAYMRYSTLAFNLEHSDCAHVIKILLLNYLNSLEA